MTSMIPVNKIEKINRDCDAIDWHAKAKALIRIKYDKNRKYFKRIGCSRGKLVPVDLPIKQIVNYEEFLFDEIRSIILVTKQFYNMAESIAIKELNIPFENTFYTANSSEPDINVLIIKAIPVVAKILKYQHKLSELDFSNEINRMLCYNIITEEDVRELAKKLH
jgi:hypothetical protein